MCRLSTVLGKQTVSLSERPVLNPHTVKVPFKLLFLEPTFHLQKEGKFFLISSNKTVCHEVTQRIPVI